MVQQLSPDCPWCGHPPQINLGTQAFCGNDACRCIMWNPTRTPADNLGDVGEVDLSGLDE